MTGRLLRAAAVLGLALAALLGSCRLALRCLPERYAVNAPIGHLLFGRGTEAPPTAELRERLSVPEGFEIGLFVDGIANARWLRFTPSGDLLVSTPRSGRVLLLRRDGDGDGRADGTETLLDGLDRPHGLDFHGEWLYVAESSGILRVRFDPVARRTLGDRERIVSDLPEGGNHWTRTLRFGPDGWMYVTVGSSCNACIESEHRRAAMLRYRPDGSEPEIYATGLRNAVGFDWQPGTEQLYATDNGRDLLGDDFPPCELNRVERGGFYGWPLANGDRVADPDLGAGQGSRIAESIPPAHGFGAHKAPLGIAFLRGEAWPQAWRGAALVALHGSWNRTRKDGYAVVSLHWGAGGRIEERPFVAGFLRDEQVIGRPVDVTEGPDGAAYVSDDYAGAVYRIAWAGDRRSRRSAEEDLPRALAEANEPLAAIHDEQRAESIARGRALFEAHACARCHDPVRADVGVVPVPLAQLGSKFRVESLAAYLRAPTPPMPAFPLTDADRRDLAMFLLDERGLLK